MLLLSPAASELSQAIVTPCVGQGKRLLEMILKATTSIVISHLVALSSCPEHLFFEAVLPPA